MLQGRLHILMLLWLQSNVLADVDMIIGSLTSSLLVMVVLPLGVFRALWC